MGIMITWNDFIVIVRDKDLYNRIPIYDSTHSPILLVPTASQSIRVQIRNHDDSRMEYTTHTSRSCVPLCNN